MKNSVKTICTVSLILAAVHLLAAFLVTLRLPETVPTHFDVNWVCDGVGSRWRSFLPAPLPLITAVISAVLVPRVKQNARLTAILLLLLTLYLGALFWMVYPTAASGVGIGDSVDTQPTVWLLPLLYSVMFVAVGNYLPVIRQNGTMGIRVSWTLQNELCWRRTHRFAGRLWFWTGIGMCVFVGISVLCGLPVGAWLYILLGEMLFADIAAPCIYAYLHKDDKEVLENA